MDILKLVIQFLTQKHPELGALLPGYDTFTRHSQGAHLEGYSRAVFSGGGWEISIGHAVTPRTVYRVTADYNKDEIVWKGQIVNGQVEEKSYDKFPPKYTIEM